MPAVKRAGGDVARRREIVETCRTMNALGINQGTSGNVSARCGGRLLITPSGVPYETLSPDDIVAMPLDADDGRYEGALAPSAEWRFHLDRSEEHTSELQSLMRISYAVFCLQKKNQSSQEVSVNMIRYMCS